MIDGPRRVLIIEPSKEIADLNIQLFGMKLASVVGGLKIISAPNPSAALAALTTFNPELVVTELFPTEPIEQQVLFSLAERYPSLAVIVYSVYSHNLRAQGVPEIWPRVTKANSSLLGNIILEVLQGKKST